MFNISLVTDPLPTKNSHQDVHISQSDLKQERENLINNDTSVQLVQDLKHTKIVMLAAMNVFFLVQFPQVICEMKIEVFPKQY